MYLGVVGDDGTRGWVFYLSGVYQSIAFIAHYLPLSVGVNYSYLISHTTTGITTNTTTNNTNEISASFNFELDKRMDEMTIGDHAHHTWHEVRDEGPAARPLDYPPPQVRRGTTGPP